MIGTQRKYVEAGREFHLYVRGSLIEAWVIGVCHDKALVEYEVVNDKSGESYSALRIINVYDDPTKKYTGPRRNITYMDNWGAPTRFAFIENAALNKREWVGTPRNYTDHSMIPTVQEAYAMAKQIVRRPYVRKGHE
jgi:hypothetical protein